MAKRTVPASATRTVDVDVCAIGAGSGGLAITRFATALGLSCALVERAAMGGDCLNGGCVPSKAFLAAAHSAEAARHARGFGVEAPIRRISGRGVYRHVNRTVAAIAPNDSQEKFEKLGAIVIRDDAHFVGPSEMVAGPHRIRARWFFIATGARAAIPALPGIEEVPYLTNETIFSLSALPRHLVIVGAGPLGVEMAQAHRRLGVSVTLVERFAMLQEEDPELVGHLRTRLRREGVRVLEQARASRVSGGAKGVAVQIAIGGRSRTVKGSHLLVAAGRKPEVAALRLANAGVAFTAEGIVVDEHLRTTNPNVYAIGDVIGGTLSHLAVHHATVAFANAVHGAKARVAAGSVPRVLYTEPELAQVGMRESDAAGRDIRVLRWGYDHNDRAAAERKPWGMVKVVLDAGGRILGAGIVGPRAGEVIQKWTLAITAGMTIQDVAAMIAPYPTIGYSDRKLAESFAGPALFLQHARPSARTLSPVS